MRQPNGRRYQRGGTFTLGARPRGERHHLAKLTDDDVDAMRELHERERAPWGYKAIAKRFGAPLRTVRDILTYKTRLGRDYE